MQKQIKAKTAIIKKTGQLKKLGQLNVTKLIKKKCLKSLLTSLGSLLTAVAKVCKGNF